MAETEDCPCCHDSVILNQGNSLNVPRLNCTIVPVFLFIFGFVITDNEGVKLDFFQNRNSNPKID